MVLQRTKLKDENYAKLTRMLLSNTDSCPHFKAKQGLTTIPHDLEPNTFKR